MGRFLALLAAALMLSAQPVAAELQEAWIAVYDGPSAGGYAGPTDIAVDESGCVYVTGGVEFEGTGFDAVTVKYGPDGDQIWSARYTGESDQDDRGRRLSLDAHGNVYVAGAAAGDFLVAKYDTSGQETWATTCGPDGYSILTGLALTSDGDVYAAGYRMWGDNDGVLVRLDSEGAVLWTETYDGGGSDADDTFRSVVVGGSGCAYVAGWTCKLASGCRWKVLKYGWDGALQWVGSLPDGHDYASSSAWDLVLTSTGEVVATGWVSNGSSAEQDCFTVGGYDALGVPAWGVSYEGAAGDYDAAVAIAAGDAGRVYVVARSHGEGGDEDVVTLAYDANGGERWVATHDGAAHLDDNGCDIAVCPGGGVFTLGRVHDDASDYDYVTLEYDTLGVEASAVRYGSNDPYGYDSPTAIAADRAGNAYATGSRIGYSLKTVYSDWVTVKYSQQPGTGAAEEDVSVWDHLLLQNAPNPFNPVTRIAYSVREGGPVVIEICSVAGRVVRRLLETELEAGVSGSVVWDGTNDAGERCASGAYFYRIVAPGFTASRRMVLLK